MFIGHAHLLSYCIDFPPCHNWKTSERRLSLYNQQSFTCLTNNTQHAIPQIVFSLIKFDCLVKVGVLMIATIQNSINMGHQYQQLRQFAMNEVLASVCNKIKSCDGSESSIEELSSQCLIKGAKLQLYVAKMLENMIEFHNTPVKLIILQVMTSILIHDSSKIYYWHLSSRIYAFLSKFRNLLSSDENSVKTLCQIFEKWKREKVFSDQFYHKLLNSCGQFLIQRINSHYQASIFTKYPLKFVESIKDIEKVAITSDLYRIHGRSYKLRGEMEQLMVRLGKVEKQESSRARDEQIQKLRELVDRLMAQQSAQLQSVQAAGNEVMALFQRQAATLGITSMAQLRQ